MPTCKECSHVEVCELCYNRTDEEYVDVANKCKHFKDRSKFIELPCKIGDTMYYICGNTVEAEKALAIYKVMNMPTHNGVSKKYMLQAVKWLWHQHYELTVEESEQK